MAAFAASLTRIRFWVDGVAGTVQPYDPDEARRLEAIFVHDAPAFAE